MVACTPTAMRGVAERMDTLRLEECLNEFRTWYRSSEGIPLLILSVCRRERHRSVAFRKLTTVMLTHKYADLDIRQGPRPRFNCGCAACNHQEPALEDSVKKTYGRFGDRCVRILGKDALNPAGSKRNRGKDQPEAQNEANDSSR